MPGRGRDDQGSGRNVPERWVLHCRAEASAGSNRYGSAEVPGWVVPCCAEASAGSNRFGSAEAPGRVVLSCAEPSAVSNRFGSVDVAGAEADWSDSRLEDWVDGWLDCWLCFWSIWVTMSCRSEMEAVIMGPVDRLKESLG